MFNALLATSYAQRTHMVKTAWAPHGTGGGDESYLTEAATCFQKIRHETVAERRRREWL